MSQAMTGDGDYDRHSEAQYRDATSNAEVVAAAAEAVSVGHATGHLVLADYGCAQGRVSNALVGVAVRRIRARHPDVPIHVVHNDVLVNDWAGLFDTLRSDASYLAIEGGPITPMIAAGSFYQPVTPPGLVDLGVSFAAAQWLSTPGPDGTGTALYFDQLTGESRAAMADRARDDWRRFLRLRADELAPGGRLVVSLMGVGEDGRAAGHDAWQLAREVVEGLVAESVVDHERVDGYVLPVYERSLSDLRSAFDESDVADRLVLEGVTSTDSVHPALERFAGDGDAEAFARDFVGFFRAFSEPSLRAGLGLTDAASADLYGRMETRLVDAAADFSFTVHVVTVVISAT